jgi:hypothetical protein
LLPEMGARPVPPGGQPWNSGAHASGTVSAVNAVGPRDAADARDEAYRGRVARLENAWRVPS